MRKLAIVGCAMALGVLLPPRVAGAEDAKRADQPPAGAETIGFEFTLDKPALTSAGIFDKDGSLVKQLWAMKQLEAGAQRGTWDGLDESGNRAPAGRYSFKVIANGSTYRNVGTLGNTKRVPTVQTAVAAMAINAEGSIYFANTWEEAGQDFNRFDKDGNTTLHAKFRVRNGTPNGFPYAIAVDEPYIYLSVVTLEKIDEKRSTWGGHVIRRFRSDTGDPAPWEKGDKFGNIRVYDPPAETNWDAGNPLKALAVTGKTLLAADARGNRVLKFDKDTGEKLGEFPVKEPCAMAVDKQGRIWIAHEKSIVCVVDINGSLLAVPQINAGEIVSMAFASNGLLYIADAADSVVKIARIDLVATEPVGPGKDAAGSEEIENKLKTKVSFDFVETPLEDVITFLHGITNTYIKVDERAMQHVINPEVTLKVTDMELKQALTWILRQVELDYEYRDAAIFISTPAMLGKGEQIRVPRTYTFGYRARPGNSQPDHFYKLACAAPDPEGNLIVAHRLISGGVIIAKFARGSGSNKCLWRHLSLGLCTIGNYSQRDPSEFIETGLNRLWLKDHDKAEWEFGGCVLDGDPGLLVWNHGVPRILRLGENDFFYQAYGDGMIAFRRTGKPSDRGGKAFRPVAIASGSNPRFDGKFNDRELQENRYRAPMQWTWTDQDGDGTIDPIEVNLFKAGNASGARYATFGLNVDLQGNIVYGEHHSHGIWELPLDKLDERGNPVYDWSKAREIVPADTTPMEFQPLMAVRADDGTLFAFGRSGYTQTTGIWKSPKNAGAWMGGWVLARYGKDNKLLWYARLPEVCVGMDAIPGREPGTCAGVMLGWYEKAVVYHYSSDGLLIGQMAPGAAADNSTGWMDNTAALALNRDPRDGIVDVFGEDSLNNRIMWYRVDDREMKEVTGEVEVR